MNLKTMDESTLMFLKELVEEFEDDKATLADNPTEYDNDLFKGWHKHSRSTLISAMLAWGDFETPDDLTFQEFLELIKNAAPTPPTIGEYEKHIYD